MSVRRTGAASASLQGKLYAVGGSDDGRQALDLVERYDPVNRVWEKCPPMLTRRFDAAAIAIGEQLFVAGGYDGTQALDTVEFFDPRENRWERLPHMESRRFASSAAVCRVSRLWPQDVCVESSNSSSRQPSLLIRSPPGLEAGQMSHEVPGKSNPKSDLQPNAAFRPSSAYHRAPAPHRHTFEVIPEMTQLQANGPFNGGSPHP